MSNTKLMGFLGISLTGTKSSTWTNGESWKERKKYFYVPGKENPGKEKCLSREGSRTVTTCLAGEAGQHSVMLVVS